MLYPPLEEMLKLVEGNKYLLVAVVTKLAHKLEQEESLRSGTSLSEALELIAQNKISIAEEATI